MDKIEKYSYKTLSGSIISGLDTKNILPFINKIRKQIGLPELTDKLDNILMEINDEVRKRLILKGLE